MTCPAKKFVTTHHLTSSGRINPYVDLRCGAGRGGAGHIANGFREGGAQIHQMIPHMTGRFSQNKIWDPLAVKLGKREGSTIELELLIYDHPCPPLKVAGDLFYFIHGNYLTYTI